MALQNKFQFKLNVKEASNKLIPVITANDHTVFLIEVYDGEFPVELLDTYRYVFASKSPKQTTAVIREATLNEDGLVVVELGYSETKDTGIMDCALQIYDENDKRVSTMRMKVNVQGDIATAGGNPSEDGTIVFADRTLLTEVIEDILGSGGPGGGGDPAEITEIKEQIEDIFTLIYTPPTVALTVNPATTVKELGETVNNIVLTANVTKRTQDITKVEFLQGDNVINDVSSPPVNGGSLTHNVAGNVTATTTFKAKAYDARGSAEASRTITFVHPMYAGVVAVAAPNEAQVKALSKLVRVKGDTPHAFTSAGQRFTFAYPASYGNLRSITDPNGFETLGSYTATTINITGLDGTAVPYRVYTLNTVTTQTNFTNTFKF